MNTDRSGASILTGQTRLAGVIGDPVRHSRSPIIHNAAYAALGMDWAYLAFPVAAGAVGSAIVGMRALGIEGLSVTMPHKSAVVGCVDVVTSTAAALGAVNSVHRDGDRLVGDNTDGGGFLDALRLDEGVDVGGMRCAVIGAGGAARAVVHALGGAGVDSVVVVNRDPRRGSIAAALAGSVGVAGRQSDLATVDLVVQATPVGMGDDVAMAFDPALLADGCVVCDLVYHPTHTPVLVAAERRGLRTVGGIGMLVHQAARQFRSWTGVEAPVDVMRTAALAGLD